MFIIFYGSSPPPPSYGNQSIDLRANYKIKLIESVIKLNSDILIQTPQLLY